MSNKNKKNIFEESVDHAKADVQNRAWQSPILPLLVMIIFGLFFGSSFIGGIAIVFLILYIIQLLNGGGEEIDLESRSSGALASLQNGWYSIFVPGWAFRILSVFTWIAGFNLFFSVSNILFIPVSLFLFLWGSTFWKLADRTEQLENERNRASRKRNKNTDANRNADWNRQQTRTRTSAKRTSRDDSFVIDGEFSESTARPDDLPETPDKAFKKVKNSSTPSLYQNILTNMEGYVNDLKTRRDSLSVFLDDFFGNSEISKSRYLIQINKAIQYANDNLNKARSAVTIFGDSKPTQARLDILHQYEKESYDLVQSVDGIVDALLQADHSQSSQRIRMLDEALDELEKMTAYYGESKVH